MHPTPDTITTYGRSVIQFGPLNNRVYLMKLDSDDLQDIVPELEELANANGLSKICAKVPQQAQTHFVNRGFGLEARIPGFFHGQENGLYLAKFLHPARSQPDQTCPEPPWETNSSQIEPGVHQPECSLTRKLSSEMPIHKLGLERAKEIARIFARNFSAYPFPLQDLDYLQECMQTNVCFFGLEMKGQIAALASSEMDEAAGHVEMTDFITLPSFRGQGLATLILQAMEQEMRMRGFWIAFSIARAGSPGINSVFARQGYAYRGRLVQNTRFNKKLEDMNVWSKRLFT
ncbi:MAG: putative beta-lysine N-acetyltransferase [Desulfovermiculus sp.]|nr:putative beta-lysine N-acetyltransferase [Desulfovermiculus sp.]